jgi:hypothetical protein
MMSSDGDLHSIPLDRFLGSVNPYVVYIHVSTAESLVHIREVDYLDSPVNLTALISTINHGGIIETQ